MKLAGCAKLARTAETRVWYRAVQAQFAPTALATLYTKDFATRYNPGKVAAPGFELLYLAEDHQVALYEVRALMPSSYPHAGALVLPNPRHAWLILNVRVRLQQVADLTSAAAQKFLGTTVQELTGDWEG